MSCEEEKNENPLHGASSFLVYRSMTYCLNYGFKASDTFKLKNFE